MTVFGFGPRQVKGETEKLKRVQWRAKTMLTGLESSACI